MPLLVGWEKTSDAAIPRGKSEGINPTLAGRAINRLAMRELHQVRPAGRSPDPAINKRRATWLAMVLRRTRILNTCIIPGGCEAARLAMPWRRVVIRTK